MTSDEENGTNNQDLDPSISPEHTDKPDSNQNILPEADSKDKGDQSGERCSGNSKNNQTEMIIPNPEGTLRLFLFHRK